MEKDLLIYLGLAFAIAAGCLIFWIKMKRLFRSSHKPKQSNNRHLLQKKPITDKGLFSFYKWRQTLRRWRGSESDFFVRVCRSGDLERVKKYIQNGGDVNVRRHRGGRTGLMLAAEKNRLDVVALLLTSGADVNLVGGGSGKNALIRAVEAGNLQISKMLVDHGSVLDVRSRISGKTALRKASASA